MANDRIELFIINEDGKRGALRISPTGLPKGKWPGRHFLTGRPSVKTAVEFIEDGGARPVDWVFASFFEFMVVSTKFRDLLASVGATGWIEYPVRILDKKGREIPGYHGIHVRGRCGPPLWDRSERVLRGPSALLGPRMRALKGYFIDPGSWDGKDLVVARGESQILVSSRLGGILCNADLSNVSVQSTNDYEVDAKWAINSFQSSPALFPSSPESRSVPTSNDNSAGPDFHVLHHIMSNEDDYVYFEDNSLELPFRLSMRQGGPVLPKAMVLGFPAQSQQGLLMKSLGMGKIRVATSKSIWKSGHPPTHDSLNIAHTGHALVSTRVLKLLRHLKATGWREFPMTLLDPSGHRFEGYHGLHITGRSGPLNWEKAERVRQYHTSSRTVWARRGPIVNPDSWDGSDLFIPEGIPWRMASGRVGRALREANLSNFESLPTREFEMLEFTVGAERKRGSK